MNVASAISTTAGTNHADTRSAEWERRRRVFPRIRYELLTAARAAEEVRLPAVLSTAALGAAGLYAHPANGIFRRVRERYNANNTGAAPTSAGVGADGTYCIFAASDIFWH